MKDMLFQWHLPIKVSDFGNNIERQRKCQSQKLLALSLTFFIVPKLLPISADICPQEHQFKMRHIKSRLGRKDQDFRRRGSPPVSGLFLLKIPKICMNFMGEGFMGEGVRPPCGPWMRQRN